MGKAKVQNTFFMSCVTTLHAPIQKQTCIFPSLPLNIPNRSPACCHWYPSPNSARQIQIQTGTVFPNCVSASSDSVSPFCPGYLSLFPPSVCFLIMFQFCQKLLVPHRPQNFCLTSFLLGWTALELGAGDFWILRSFPGPIFFKWPNPTGLFQAEPWRSQGKLSSSTGLCSCFLPAFSFQESKCCHLVVTTATASFELHIPNKLFIHLFFPGRKPIAGTLYNVNLLFCSLILTHKLSAGSSSIPRQSSMHPGFLSQKATPAPWLPGLSFLHPSLQHSTAAMPAIPAPHRMSWTHLSQADADPSAGTHSHRTQNAVANTSSVTSCWHAVSASSFLHRFPSKERRRRTPAGPPCPWFLSTKQAS